MKPFKATVTARSYPFDGSVETFKFTTYEAALEFAAEEVKWEGTKEVFLPAYTGHHSKRLRGDFA